MGIKEVQFAVYIQAHEPVDAEALAAHLGIGARSVRLRISEANSEMEPFARIEHKRGSGYVLSVQDPAAYSNWLIAERLPARPGNTPDTFEDRVRYILGDLLLRSAWMTLEDYSQELFLSRSSLSAVLQEVERQLTTWGLSLEKKPHYGIRVAGPETARRGALAGSVASAYEGAEAELLESLPTTEAPKISIDQSLSPSELYQRTDAAKATIVEIVEQSLAENGVEINPAARLALLNHILIAFARIQTGGFAPVDQKAQRLLGDSSEHRAAQGIVRGMSERFEMEIPDGEVCYLAIHIAGKRQMGDAPDDSLVVSEEVWGVVSEMVETVWNIYRLDFRQDLELHMNLARHVVPLLVRLRYHMPLSNPMLDDIKLRFPLAYSMAADASTVLVKHCGERPSNDEVAYIALAFALALERQRTDAPKKTVLVVCSSGAASARLLKARCKSEFGEYVGEVRTCDVAHVANIDFSDIDYVFATIPLPIRVPVPVREVRYFFDSDEVKGLRSMLHSDAHHVGINISKVFSSSLFFPHLACASKDEVLDCLCSRLASTTNVGPDFRELVAQREEALPTSFGNLVAAPHPTIARAERTQICVGILDEPIVWDENGHEVQVVFLMSLAENGEKGIDRLFSLLAELFASQQAIARLISEQSWECLNALLVAYYEKTESR